MLTSFSSRLRARRLAPQLVGSLLATLATFTASGCSSLPALSAVNPFAVANPTKVTQEPLIVESVAVQEETMATSQNSEPVAPVALPQPAPDSNQAWSHLGKLSDSRRALAKRLRAQNQVASESRHARAVVLGETQGVMDLPPSYWAVQVAAVKNIERVAQMVKENRLEGMLGVPMNTEAGPLHAVLTGVFVSREDAQASAENLHPALAGYQPWVRPLAHLQAAMR